MQDSDYSEGRGCSLFPIYGQDCNRIFYFLPIYNTVKKMWYTVIVLPKISNWVKEIFS